MSIIKLNNKQQIVQYLLRYPQFNYYHLGDLDDFFWPYTTWYGWEEQGELKALALLYSGAKPAAFLAFQMKHTS